ncbi:MAG: UbiA family prenyltransferase [Planctomycetota bacterium]|jgi:4-hydroxybenzoate polyprenyltransferase
MSRFAGHVRLLRLPLIGTAVADVSVGWFGAAALGYAPPAGAQGGVVGLLLLHAAACCFYGAGMTLNDVFDATRDHALHPERPIPSGVVSRPAAALQGCALLAVGLGFAFVAGPRHGMVAIALAGALALYDGAFKRFAIPGALAMGAVRYLDVQLGAGFAAGPLFLPALLLGFYTFFLTWISTYEEAPERSRSVRALVLVLCAVVGACGFGFPRYLLSVWYFALVGMVAAVFGMRVVHDKTARSVRSLTLALLLGMFLVNAGSLTGLGRWDLGLATASLALSFPIIAKLTSPPRSAATPISTPPSKVTP